ncbi:MAG: CPBP family intramembrane metalloprotease [Methylococcaceae bacterium]|nr:CPBP family intramembrane metalloprotease [Methylococcaceae bacterium]MCI0668077.1 CPBP family intramembrane metalloprotease [Methylococcaceae bacterium]MCI0734391.1 CPBP family intramembrane metalloprotease [Methylococcaceae bacterium]
MYSKYAPWLLFSSALAYLLSAILIAALLAYPIYFLIDLKIAFPRLVNRIGLGLLIIGIFPVRKKIGLSPGEMGFPGTWSSLVLQFSRGFLLGAVILGVVVIALIALDVRSILQSPISGPDRVIRHLAGAMGTGMIVSVLEESLFRGLLFGALLKYGTIRSALVITAFFYAGLHFIGGRGEVPAADLRWTTGLELVPAALSQIFNPAHLDSFLALFVVSLFLSAVLIETPRGIGYCIGLHAAWVFVLKLTKRYTEAVPDNPWGFLVGSYDGVIGYLVMIWLLVITLVYGHQVRKKLAIRKGAAKH